MEATNLRRVLLRPPPRPSGRKRLWQVLHGKHVENEIVEEKNPDGSVHRFDRELIYGPGDVFESDAPLDLMYNCPQFPPSQQKFREVNSELPAGFAGGMNAADIERWKADVEAAWRKEFAEREVARAQDIAHGQEPALPPVGLPGGPGSPTILPEGTKTAKDVTDLESSPGVAVVKDRHGQPVARDASPQQQRKK